MIQRHRCVSTLLAAILGLWSLGAPLSVGAAIAPPTNLRPVQSKADCATALSLLAFICGAGVTGGDLQLIWDESDKSVTGYNVYRFVPGGQKLLGTAAARYFLVKKPPEGYANLCFTVEAYVGKQTSADSSHYCYAPGATATTLTFKATRTATVVPYLVILNCSQNAFQGTSSYSPPLPGVTVLFPWLPRVGEGKQTLNGTYAGNVAARAPVETQSCQNAGAASASAWINAFAGVAFDTGGVLAHRIYSATLTLTALQTVTAASGRLKLSNGGWCPIWVRAGEDPWWRGPSGNLFGSTEGQVKVVSRPATGTIDVTSVVSAFGLPYGIILVSPDTPPNAPQNNYIVPNATNTCLTKFTTPSLQIVHF